MNIEMKINEYCLKRLTLKKSGSIYTTYIKFHMATALPPFVWEDVVAATCKAAGKSPAMEIGCPFKIFLPL